MKAKIGLSFFCIILFVLLSTNLVAQNTPTLSKNRFIRSFLFQSIGIFIGIQAFQTDLSAQIDFKIGAGIHSSEWSDTMLDLQEFDINSEGLDYHLTGTIKLNAWKLFAETGLQFNVDTYKLAEINATRVACLLPLQVGIHILKFDFKTGLVGSFAFANSSNVLQQVTENTLPLQYMHGIGISLDRVYLELNYSTSSPYLLDKVIKRDLSIDNSIADRLFLTAGLSF